MAEQSWERLFVNASVATMVPGAVPYGAIEKAAIGVREGRLVYVGPEESLPSGSREGAQEVVDLGGAWVTPGLVDCHTHLVYAGNRAAEYEQRLQGVSYEEIARGGGGIRSTVRDVRAADEDRLVLESAPRLQALMSQGVTAVEIKSGYGLELEAESRMLRAARRLGREHDVQVGTTFLGAHTVPEEFVGRADDYIDRVVEEMLPAVVAAGLADAVDAFCEGIAFTPPQVARVFEAACRFGMPLKVHAEQLSDQKGALLASTYGALSADHLEYLAEGDIKELRSAGTVAVLLPAAYYFLGGGRKPPIAALRKAGVPLALGTDCNPGSSPTTSPLLTMNFACTLFGFTPEESLAGFTRCGAQALGVDHEVGTLEVGKRADFAVWEIDTPAELSYHLGRCLLQDRVIGGRSSPRG